MNVAELAVNRVISFLYPRHNVHGMASQNELRRCKVNRIRDLFAEPLDPMTLALSPALRRSRFLVEAFDLDKLADRQFYADSMQPVQEREYTVTDMTGRVLFTTTCEDAAREFVQLWGEPCILDSAQ